ncbi:hypothetical protein LINPERHAP2_LOCUS15973 [Linum perenne]
MATLSSSFPSLPFPLPRVAEEGFFKAEGNCSDGGCEVDVEEEDPVPISEGKEGSSTVKRRREFLEEARKSVLECGKVMHLVKAFVVRRRKRRRRRR